MGTDCKSALSLLKNIYTYPSDRVELNQIIGDSYEFTDVIGTWARKNNYEGIIYPSARGTQYNNYFINVILFKSSTANKIVKGKIIEKIIN